MWVGVCGGWGVGFVCVWLCCCLYVSRLRFVGGVCLFVLVFCEWVFVCLFVCAVVCVVGWGSWMATCSFVCLFLGLFVCLGWVSCFLFVCGLMFIFLCIYAFVGIHTYFVVICITMHSNTLLNEQITLSEYQFQKLQKRKHLFSLIVNYYHYQFASCSLHTTYLKLNLLSNRICRFKISLAVIPSLGLALVADVL